MHFKQFQDDLVEKKTEKNRCGDLLKNYVEGNERPAISALRNLVQNFYRTVKSFYSLNLAYMTVMK